MNSNTAIKFAPFFSDDRRIDVSVESGETEISLSTWTDGLGWCTQKTMKLDAELLEDLHRVVSAARLKVQRNNDTNSSFMENSGKVIDFPKFV